MGRKKISVELYSYGLYSGWDKGSKELPLLLDITDRIKIEPGVEFGCVIKIKGAKGKTIAYRIDHPGFPDSEGNKTPPFTGDYFISGNDYVFFLGDTVWEPYEDKVGSWCFSTYIGGKRTSYKKLILYIE